MMRRLLIWGAGTLGGQVAELWLNSGGAVIGFTKSDTRHAHLRAMGVEPHQGNPVGILRPGDALLLALPGHAKQREGIQVLVRQNVSPPARVILIASTGYYGTAISGTINEDTSPGNSQRAQNMAETEADFRTWAGERGIVIRLGGLYGFGRGPLPALARRGYPLLRPPDKTMALIHYDDAAAATVAALQHPSPEPVYLAVTPPCPQREEFYRLACQKLQLPDPRFDEPTGLPPAEFDVTRLRRDLLPIPACPNWQAALEV
jgi:nucleoside-diphosphate-sugar epimerase